MAAHLVKAVELLQALGLSLQHRCLSPFPPLHISLHLPQLFQLHIVIANLQHSSLSGHALLHVHVTQVHG